MCGKQQLTCMNCRRSFSKHRCSPPLEVACLSVRRKWTESSWKGTAVRCHHHGRHKHGCCWQWWWWWISSNGTAADNHFLDDGTNEVGFSFLLPMSRGLARRVLRFCELNEVYWSIKWYLSCPYPADVVTRAIGFVCDDENWSWSEQLTSHSQF